MKKKLKLNLGNRGYLQIDFAFAIFVFLIVFIFFYNYYVASKQSLVDVNEISKMQLEAQDLCFMLSNSVGNPTDWNSDVNNTVFFGFKKDKDISLDQLKLDEFNNDNYFVIVDKMNITHNLGIIVEGVSSGVKYVEFGVFPDNNVVYANYQCFVFYDSEIVKVFVEVWE